MPQASLVSSVVGTAVSPGGLPGGGGTVTVHVKDSLSLPPRPSFTVAVTAYGLPADAPLAIVPVMRPVVALTVSPGGRPLAPYDRASASGSVAWSCSDAAEPSTPDWFA